ncbi:MAG: cation:proton antiporter [Elusimicrobiales bacterium]|jgi:Kef-type K+ transport system membrane component KefB
MEHIYQLATIYIALAVTSAIIAYHLKISIALIEITVGAIVANIALKYAGINILEPNTEWIKVLASFAAILLTFLAGTELDPKTLKDKRKESLIIGTIGFLAPFIGGYLVSKYLVGWSRDASLLVGIALSTTSMAVVYAVMIETGLNSTEFGKGILASCFLNDIGTVLALGFVFSPFNLKTVVFILVSAVVIFIFPKATDYLTNIYGNRTAAIRAKFVMLVLLFLGFVAVRSDVEPVLPAYIAGMVLAEFSIRNKNWILRMRTLTIGFLTPFYFLRAGSFVSFKSLISAPLIFIFLFLSKVLSKIFGLYPFISMFRKEKNERMYYTLLMSTGLTFGTISALFGYTHGIIDQTQYSLIVMVVIASAVIPTAIATLFFEPKHLIPAKKHMTETKDELIEE